MMMTRYEFAAGDRPLDGYTIEYALGRGGFGEVYYAVSDAGRQVALKSIRNYEEVELRGIGHCMNLKSQHLVSIFDVKKDAEGMPWVIMEFVSGPSLREILDDSPHGLAPQKAAFFLRELAKGLSYLHGAGVVHRDLKPHNIFFEEGIVKIGDYSLSKGMTASHRSGHTMTVGTVHYMAPEIGEGRYDKTVDIYALGVILHEMLTGSPPYQGESMGEVLMKHLSSEPDVAGIEEPFASVIRTAMKREPAERFQSAEDMVDALKGAIDVDSVMEFGPASLSIVADRATRQARVRSDDSTGRIDPSLTATQAANLESKPVHPIGQLGRDLVALAQVVGLANDEDRAPGGALQEDSMGSWGRRILSLLSLAAMTFVGVLGTDVGRRPGASCSGAPDRRASHAAAPGNVGCRATNLASRDRDSRRRQPGSPCRQSRHPTAETDSLSCCLRDRDLRRVGAADAQRPADL